MVFIARETKQKLWEERITSFRASGLTRKAWCQEQQIPESQLHYWLGKFKRLSEGTPPTPDRWIGLEPASLGDTGISIQVGEISLAVKRGFDRQVLSDVIRAILTVC